MTVTRPISVFAIVEPPARMPYLTYKEDVSKTGQGGLKQCKLILKEVVHHANHENPSRCLVRRGGGGIENGATNRIRLGLEW